MIKVSAQSEWYLGGGFLLFRMQDKKHHLLGQRDHDQLAGDWSQENTNMSILKLISEWETVISLAGKTTHFSLNRAKRSLMIPTDQETNDASWFPHSSFTYWVDTSLLGVWGCSSYSNCHHLKFLFWMELSWSNYNAMCFINCICSC